MPLSSVTRLPIQILEEIATKTWPQNVLDEIHLRSYVLRNFFFFRIRVEDVRNRSFLHSVLWGEGGGWGAKLLRRFDVPKKFPNLSFIFFLGFWTIFFFVLFRNVFPTLKLNLSCKMLLFSVLIYTLDVKAVALIGHF